MAYCNGLTDEMLAAIPAEQVIVVGEKRGVSIIDMAKIGCLPLGKFPPNADEEYLKGNPPPPPTPEQIAAEKAAQEKAEAEKLALYREIWADLLSAASTNSLDAEAVFILTKRLPGGCGCQADVKQYVADNPPPVTDQIAWVKTWQDAIKKRMGKV